MTLSAQQLAFLDAYRQHGTVRRAYRQSGVTRQQVYVWKRDEEFRQAMLTAEREAGENLIQAALRRAKAGITCFGGPADG